MRSKKNNTELASLLVHGDRRALAQAITLVESTVEEDRSDASKLIDKVLAKTGNSIRIGISGPPGVGKSSFIEALGKHILRSTEHKIAVLAIDPSSQINRGSILGDKTRMEEISKNDRVFVRPSPSGSAVGGVARRTRETILLTEAAGHEIIIIETVGIGQSESKVAGMVDMYILLHQPNSGDDLQGIKRGNLELADLVVVTKADGENKAAADRARVDLSGALGFFSTTENPAPKVLSCSSHDNTGISVVFQIIIETVQSLKTSGRFAERRRSQNIHWFHDEIQDQLLEMVARNSKMAKSIEDLEKKIATGTKLPVIAATEVIDCLLGPKSL